ncbi:MAG: DUF1579 family protein [Planctomycetota bacterium]
MLRSLAPILSVLTLAAGVQTVRAQDMPQPAPELQKLSVFVGDWEGSGTAVMAPGQPESGWTSQTTYRWALGKHFLQADTSIVFEGQPQPMVFREFMGWDRENRRYVNLAVNNMGEAGVHPVHFVGDDSLCGLMLWVRDGEPQAERALTKFTKDSMSMSITFLGVEGPAREGVTGTFRRVAKAQPTAIEAAHSLWGNPAEMQKMVRMCGTFDVAGSMVMAPGTPEFPITGRDTIRSLFDGAIVHIETHGQPDYESQGFYSWSAADQCYLMSYANSMGQVGSMKVWFADDNTLVGTSAGLDMGTPSAQRVVVTLDDQGRPKNVLCHGLIGTHAPMRTFEADYTLAQGK